MANNPCINLLCGIWSCIKGSLRIILFFGCLVFVLIQLCFVLQQYSDTDSEFVRSTLLGRKVGLSDRLAAIFMLFIALLGAYGSFYKHHRSLKLFATLVAVVSIILTISLTYGLMNNELDKEHEKFIDRMRNYSMHYDWTEGVHHGDKNLDATKSWDMLQALMCCGIDGPKDWDKSGLRPGYVSDSDYPTSCCLPTFKFQHCHKAEIYTEGCLSRILAIEAITVVISIFYCSFLFLLCIIAYALLLPEASDAVSTSSHRGVLPQDYQRFEGSVYVRQPAMAPQYPQPIPKDPPMYPNAQNVEKKGPSSPPPSYY